MAQKLPVIYACKFESKMEKVTYMSQGAKYDGQWQKDVQSLSSVSVFLVEDNPQLLEFELFLLQSAGVSCHGFPDGAAALAAFKAANPRPNLLLTDFNLPEMDGVRLIEECKAMEPGLKTILTSGTVNENILADCNVKVDRFFQKPWDPDEVLSTVRAMLQA